MIEESRVMALKNWRSLEQISYWLVWIVLGFLPLVFWDFNEPHEQARIVAGWVRIFPFFVIFMVHNYLLLPQLLLKKHYMAWAIITLVFILLVNYWFVVSEFFHNTLIDILEKSKPHVNEGINSMNDHALRRKGKWGGPGGNHRGAKYWNWHNPAYLVFTYNVFTSLLLIGFNTAFRFATQWLNQEQQQKEKEKEAIQSQLNALQNQVSPHFFMNTLNNIHALIDFNKEDAKDAVLRLSKMMRYLLYESDHGKTSLKRELEFLHSYIDLMKLRLQPEVDLRVDFPVHIPDVEIFSLLTLSFIENSFKHGIDPRAKSYIHILLELADNAIHFNIKNSRMVFEDAELTEGGIGIENARKRLDLLYGSSYKLNIYNRENEFEVDLIYPLI